MFVVSELMQRWCRDARIEVVDVLWRIDRNTLYVYTRKPGHLIGPAGCYFDTYTAEIKKSTSVNCVKIVECCR